MKTLAVCVLGCAMMFLVRATALPEAQAETNQTSLTELSEMDKRTVHCYGRRYFFYVSRPMTWVQAERNCVRRGGHLASVHSRREYRIIQKLVRRAGCGRREVWIGGHRRRYNVWAWSDGTRFGYRHWCCGEPNNYGGRQNCLQMNHSARRCWDDLQCWAYRPSVCVRRRW